MRRTTIFHIQLLIVVLLSTFSSASLRAQSSRTFPTLDLALEAIRNTYAVATGLDVAKSDADKSPITLDLTAKDVSNVFDQIVAQRPMYVWTHDHGVYDLYPKTAEDGISALRVLTYFVEDATAQEASDAIDRLPEFQNWLSEQHKTRSEIVAGQRWPNPEKRISVALNNAELRTILNELITKFGDPQWVTFHHGEKMQRIAIYF